MSLAPRGVRDCAVQHVTGLMQRFAQVRARPMFGGHGLYRDDTMFALLAKGELYLKVDAQSASLFEARGLRAFAFEAKGRVVRLSYHEAPPEALEGDVAMAHWCDLAWQAALRSKSAVARRGKKLTAHADAVAQVPLSGLPNLGPRGLEWLASAGITSLARLQELGSVRAFVLTRACNPGVSLNLLWALEGALSSRRWQDVAETDRASLLMALEDVVREDV